MLCLQTQQTLLNYQVFIKFRMEKHNHPWTLGLLADWLTE